MSPRFYVTTPIYYVNDVPHLGHAYTTIAADALARYHRLRGAETRFLTGTDEHGQKIEQAAKERGMSERAFVDEVSQTFRALPKPLHCEPDDFIRTTEPRHVEVVQDLWRKCEKNGAIYEGVYEGLYCVHCEAYYTEKELEQTPTGFVCAIHKKPVDKVKEPSFFFRLSAFEKKLLDWYGQTPSPVQPESRRNEVVSFVKGGLQDLSISRTSFKWGIEVPGHPGHVVYVWFDALTNYYSALQGDLRAKFWPCDVHLIGKDILRFHAVYWPAFLMAAGLEPPKQVFAHGWLTINGQKMSKSLKNTVAPAKLAEAFGADVVRYYLLREVAFGQDGDFSHAQLIARYNSELADSLGNLLNRTLGLCAKLRAGGGEMTASLLGQDGPLELKLCTQAEGARKAFIEAFAEIAPHRALEALMTLCRAANKYIDEAAPWSVAKKGDIAKKDVDVILASALEALLWIATMLWPVMPEVSGKIFAQLGRPAVATKTGSDALASLKWEPKWDATRLQAGVPIFPKIDAEKQAEIFARLGVETSGSAPTTTATATTTTKKKGIAEPAAEIAYEEFGRMDLRIGKIVSAERVPKSDKLLKLMVDVGEGSPRQVVAGIGKSFAPESLVSQHVVVVANLKPAKLMGLESRGMVLAASGEGGESDLALLTVTKDRAPGTRIK